MSSPKNWKQRLHEIIFEADTPAGKNFDIALLCAIVISVVVVTLESVASFRQQHGAELRTIEWFFTILFSIEYLLRLLSVSRPFSYAFSFYGLIDLLAIIPTYLSLFISGTQSLLVIRALRLLRIFRVLKLMQFVGEAQVLSIALKASARKIIVFLGVVMTGILILGASMHLIEGEEHGFTSIPQGMYWAIVTMTTVGYGDLVPQTPVGKLLASMMMIMGYGIIAVPTGIVSVELSQVKRNRNTQACPSCSEEGHDDDATFCKFCGVELNP